ncbi:hypothetical protein B0H11DRAFT_1920482 [Mycena galericulata]|nr:hypothetical protein B0H11DRAFT_1920482 [Mycena galericulata]
MVRASWIISSLLIGSGLAAAASTAQLETTPTELSKDGFIGTVIEWLATPVLGQFLAWGVGSLAEVAFQSAIPCLGEFFSGTSQTCLWLVIEAAIGDWDTLFQNANGRRKRDASGSYIGTIPYKLRNSTIVLIIYATLAARPNASSWAHAYTRQYGNTTPIRVFHRRINDAEEGDDTGRVNQLRAGATWTPTMLRKRVEEDDSGVVLDYLWTDSSVGAWAHTPSLPDIYHDDSPVSDTAEDSATVLQASSAHFTSSWHPCIFFQGYMNDNNAIATCATPLLDSDGLQQATAGVLAFGWNDEPFGFDGRSSGWLSGCAVDGDVHLPNLLFVNDSSSPCLYLPSLAPYILTDAHLHAIKHAFRNSEMILHEFSKPSAQRVLVQADVGRLKGQGAQWNGEGKDIVFEVGPDGQIREEGQPRKEGEGVIFWEASGGGPARGK